MSGTLPKWLEHLLGVQSAGSGEGTLWTLRDSWPLAPWITLLALGGCLALIVSCYLREAGSASRGYRLALAAIRSVLVGILFFMLAEFLLSLERTGLPYVVVIVDDSRSMSIEDRYSDEKLRTLVDAQLRSASQASASRLGLAKSLLLGSNSAVLRAIDDRYKLKVYFLDDTARLQSGDLAALERDVREAQPAGESTRLGQGIRTVLNDLRGTPPTAIVLLSDGVTTEGESLADAAGYARRKGVPLFIVGLGSETPVRDLELSDLMVEDTVFVDDIVNFEFKLTATGYQGRKLDVVLHRRGDRTALTTLQVVAGPDGKPQRVRLPYRPDKVGEFEYVVEVQHLADEIQADNNSQQRLVSVR
ncbi:MAG TPA: vWA domain-containing protein, partial [Pirellulales bacterium]|nr:vWA domain-containing protein [Pirellulales bacterium]